MKGARRKAREHALQILYQLDVNEDLTPEAGLDLFEKSFSQKEASEEALSLDEFTKRLILGVTGQLKELDAILQGVSEHWRPERMALVDRNILRLGVFELRFCDDIPATVSINEMIEIAKQFGSESSAAFINGILDKIKGELVIPAKAP